MPDWLSELLQAGNPAGVKRVTEAMLGMVKLQIAALERAYEPNPLR